MSGSLAGFCALPQTSGLGEGVLCNCRIIVPFYVRDEDGSLRAREDSWPCRWQGLLQPASCVLGAISYTMLYNCLDFPAGVVPVTTVTAEDDAQMEHYRGYFGDIWDTTLKKVKPAQTPCCRGQRPSTCRLRQPSSE